ncbi:MAG: hypothetical protein ACE15B_16765 [Bryobacteraceae bacterium]
MGVVRVRLVIALALCAGPLCGSGLRAGAAKSVITPDLSRFHPVYMAGFGQNRVATGVHDPLYARCIAIETGARPLAVCALDLVGLFYDDVRKVREAVPEADVVVASTHTHEGPDTMGLWGPERGKSGINEDYNALVVRRTAETARAAVRTMQPAAAALASVRSPELDSFIDDNRPPQVHDSELIVLQLRTAAGKPIATAVNWANHPETLGSKNTLITADYPAALYAELERRMGGVAALWNGAVGGMQSPLGAKLARLADGTFEKAEAIGRRVAELAAGATAKKAAITRVDFRESMVNIPVANAGFRMAQQVGLFGGRRKDTGAETAVPVGYVRMAAGGRPLLEIALAPGEVYPELSVGGVERYAGADFPEAPVEPALKSLMRAPYRMLIGLANDEIGYIIPKAEWDEKAPYLRDAKKAWYGEVNSMGPETAGRIAAAFAALAR